MHDPEEFCVEERLIAACRARGLTLATAESCTGGMIAARITAVAGASDVFLGGVVCYANALKHTLLGAPRDMLARDGAVSAACAAALAEGVRARVGSDLAVAVTGIAGPSGGTPLKPVGLVYLGLSDAHGARTEEHRFSGCRDTVRRQAADRALAWLLASALSAPMPDAPPSTPQTPDQDAARP